MTDGCNAPTRTPVHTEGLSPSEAGKKGALARMLKVSAATRRAIAAKGGRAKQAAREARVAAIINPDSGYK